MSKNTTHKTMYKLTSEDMKTFAGTEWTVGEWKETSGEGEMCGPGWLHCYEDPRMAVIFNPIHAVFLKPRLWEIEVAGKHTTDGLKHATTKQRLVREIELPEIPVDTRVRLAIACVKEVCTDETWLQWAENYQSTQIPNYTDWYKKIRINPSAVYRTIGYAATCAYLARLGGSSHYYSAASVSFVLQALPDLWVLEMLNKVMGK